VVLLKEFSKSSGKFSIFPNFERDLLKFFSFFFKNRQNSLERTRPSSGKLKIFPNFLIKKPVDKPYWMAEHLWFQRLWFDKSVFQKRKFGLGTPAFTDGDVKARLEVVGQFPIGYECANYHLALIASGTTISTGYYLGNDDKVESYSVFLELHQVLSWCLEADRLILKQPDCEWNRHCATHWSVSGVSLRLIIGNKNQKKQ